MDKWDYIVKIRDYPCNEYGDKLLEMLDKYDKNNLQDVTYEEVKKIYNSLKRR